MSDIFQFESNGEVLSCGCLEKTGPIPVGASAEENLGVWTLDQCKAALQSTGRIPRLEIMKRDGFLDIFLKKAQQFRTSACNGWLTANAYTTARYFGGVTDQVVYSGAYNYSLMNGGVDEGSALIDGLHTASQNGFVPVDQCSWSMIYRRQTKQFDAIAAQNKAADPFPIQSELGFLTGMAQGGLGGVCIQAGNHIEDAGSDGIAGTAKGGGNHAVLCLDAAVGKSGDVEYLLYLDWGKSHGQNGFITVTWDSHLAQTCGRHQFWIMPVGQGQ